MKILVPKIEVLEGEGFSSEVDIFNRKQFGESLLSLIKNTDDELVVALDSPWGEGKSTFIKMWQGLLNDEGVKNIYFDCFENDYQEEPILAISSQIYSLVEKSDPEKREDFKNKTVSALKVVGRAGLRVGVRALTAGILDDTMFDSAGAAKDFSKEASGIADDYVGSLLSRASKDKSSLDSFRKCLADFGGSSGGDSPIVFIIDELDRCKPKYALAILESIKHFFSVPNIVFLLVMNRKQMEESVRCEYGREVDASKYLQKFVSIWTSLPKVREGDLSVARVYVDSCLKRMGFVATGWGQTGAVDVFKDLVTHYDLSLREIEKSLTNFAIIHNATQGSLRDVAYSIAVFVAVTKVSDHSVYLKLESNSISYKEIISRTSLSGLHADWWSDKPEGHLISYTLKYLLGSEEEIKELMGKGNFFQGQNPGKRLIPRMCRALETFRIA